MRLSNKIVLASMNVDKFQEFQAIFSAYPEIELIPMEGLVRNPEKLAWVEKHETYLENAIAKARLVNSGCHYPALADDSGLEVDALGGKPGVHSRRFAKPPGGIALPRAQQDQANIELVLSELRKSPGNNRSSRFVCTLSLLVEGILVHATGTLEGTLIEQPRGENGFGYDPIFVPKGYQKTLAEMSDNEKNSISHRSKAVHALMAQIRTRGIVFAKP